MAILKPDNTTTTGDVTVNEYLGAEISAAPPTEKKTLYYIRKSFADAKSQIGAYENLDNAKNACKSGYSVFDENGKVVFSNAVESYAKGIEITLKNTTLYASSSAESGIKRSGTYFLYDGLLVNGRYRITNDRKNCGNTPIDRYVTGWVEKSDI